MAKKNPAIIKRDTRKNWEKSKYIPDENVIIIMDNEDGTISLMVGDGETNVNHLPDILNEKPKREVSLDGNTLIL
jgi:hypothetical protein